ncbi:MAG: universal stress protein [Chloroflexi bacterium]|nr:universal stress protein [Chloroflexota bacterium]
MNAAPFPILLCTNGDAHTQPALEYGMWLAERLGASVTLLGAIEHPQSKPLVEFVLAQTARRLQEAGVPCETLTDEGRGSVVIARHACPGECLTLVGPLGRPAWRRVIQGRSIRRILARVASPLLYVPSHHPKIEKILLCLGGLEYSSGLQQLTFHLAQRFQAHVTLLHVVEPITLHYPLAQNVHDHWRQILETDTPQGRNLRAALEQAQQAGLPAAFKVRSGSIVHEIIEEARSGGYDLVALGSPYSAHSLRHYTRPNVTAEVAEALKCPLLTCRQQMSLNLDAAAAKGDTRQP